MEARWRGGETVEGENKPHRAVGRYCCLSEGAVL